MRKNNKSDMTVVEQIVAIREDICSYCCKYRDEARQMYDDRTAQLIYIQRYCHECPMGKLHYERNSRKHDS